MARTWLAVLPLVLCGCTISWGGPTEHRPAIEAELDADRPRTNYRETWQPDPQVMERAILESVKDGGTPRDDSPTFLGPSHLAGSNAPGDRDPSDPKELKTRLAEYDERRSARIEEERRGPEPSHAEVDHAVDLWEKWKAEHGFAPIDLSTVPPPPPSDKKGP